MNKAKANYLFKNAFKRFSVVSEMLFDDYFVISHDEILVDMGGWYIIRVHVLLLSGLLNPKTGAPVIRHNRQVYNLADWEYGFSDCEEIESPERAASYITKYITAALLTDKTM